MQFQCTGSDQENVPTSPEWQHLPHLVLIGVFAYLPRRDRLACTMVCTRWRNNMDTMVLWRHFIVYLDTDLAEPSTILTVRYYHRYLRSLELDWQQPDGPQRWLPFKVTELTKRICRLLIVMLDVHVQLRAIALHRFYERFRMKKVTYYVSRFLRSQTNLKKVDFTRALFHKQHFLRHFQSLKNSFSTLTHLNLLDSYFGSGLLPPDFAIAFVQMRELRSLKVDYVTFCFELVDTLIHSGHEKHCLSKLLQSFLTFSGLLRSSMTKLAFLELHHFEDDEVNPLNEHTWTRLLQVSPTMKVALYFNDISHISRLKNKLQATMPLVSCSINCNKNTDEFFGSDYGSKDLITFIARHYANTLEHFKLRLKDNQTIVDDLLLELAIRCTKLESLEFFGIVHNLEVLQEIFGRKTNDFKCFSIATQSVSRRNFQLLVKIHDELSANTNCHFDLKVWNRYSENLVSIHG